ncbi:sporulation protein [Thermanaerosceptrum fracticalcis]|uniref:Sporulation protein n=2 Tax=Thermanaerosceptrum fracticalcis TaxID=1712410 RepID=A0A7G6E2R3_THEFR|nr:spore germination protein GerW family protein [Thermanaerosceptrum fracticalcis]QNB46367.1 sporulation protein [Thermanaerosceptrum fracticalcis]
MNMNENLNTLFERLEKFFRTETVVGNPMKIGEVTLVPIIDIGFGLGTGGGYGKDEKSSDGQGMGAGVGAEITPNSILIIKGEEVSLLPLKNKSSLEKIMEMIPDIVSKVKGEKEEKNSCCE